MGKTQYQEVMEAIAAGEEALSQVAEVERNLSSAKGWGWFDLFSDGGLLTALIKHSKLDKAQEAMNRLNYTINRFNSELSDIHISSNVGAITMSTGMQLADWFFDGLLVDGITLSRIGDSQREVADLKKDINHAMERLYYLKDLFEKQDY
ncbi:MAG: hypothetical protein MJ194_03390 [Clostridia bacterium]|nr:hypothetical protein [Clostridia bacterium]